MKIEKSIAYDFLFVLFLIILSLFIWSSSTKIHVAHQYDLLGPSFLPKFIAQCLLLFSIVIAVQGYMKVVKQRDKAVEKSEEPEQKLYKSRPITAFIVISLIILYLFAMQYMEIGYRLATCILIPVVGFILHKKEKKISDRKFIIILVPITIFMSFGLFYIFINILSVNLR